MRLLSCLLAVLLALAPMARPLRAEGPDTPARAAQHYASGVSLFEAGNKEQALVEFSLAQELAPKKENLFMVAQCQYHLGLLKEARTHYQRYLDEQATGEFADLARMRIDAINRRPAVLVINTVPDQVDVRIEGEGRVFGGDAPNEFRVPRGSYRVKVSKPNFVDQEREIAVDVADTKPLFFKLDPIPARLEIHTMPSHATLYIRGNRTENPYVQDVDPGHYEIYAESSYYLPRREIVSLAPGQKLKLDFPLTYVQRSGRPELIGFWAGLGAIGGGVTVMTRSGSTSLVVAGGLAGGIGAGVISAALVPDYIRDNLALFRIGGMWIGDMEGVALGLGLTQNLTGAWAGGVMGLAAGALTGWWLDDYAPNYGRVAMIQSGALLGALAGGLAPAALGLVKRDGSGNPDYHLMSSRTGWGVLAGLNVGLAAGLAMAYLPDQNVYGPSWQRIALIDLSAAAGGVTGALLQICSKSNPDKPPCESFQLDRIDRRTARFALVGAGVGLVAGWLLTWRYDNQMDPAERRTLSALPVPGVMPVQTSTGHEELIPGLVSQGSF